MVPPGRYALLLRDYWMPTYVSGVGRIEIPRARHPRASVPISMVALSSWCIVSTKDIPRHGNSAKTERRRDLIAS